MAVRFSELHSRWLEWTADRYGLLLGLICVTYASMILLDVGKLGDLTSSVLVAIIVLVAIDVSKVPRKVRIIVRLLVLLLPLAIVVYAIDNSIFRGVFYFVMALVLATTPVVILIRIIGHERINLATLLAAVDVYLLIGVVFALFYMGCSHVPALSPVFAQAGMKQRSDYVYFSYIVLTTVGFGDYSPLSKMARTLVVTEALVGQIFLVTAVARIVSLYGRQSPSQPMPQERGDEALDHSPHGSDQR